MSERQEVTVTFDDVFADEGVPILIDGAGNAMAEFYSEPVANRSTNPVFDYSAEVTTDVVLSYALIELEEGESWTYTVALSSHPSEDVLVNITSTPYVPLALPFLTITLTPEN